MAAVTVFAFFKNTHSKKAVQITQKDTKITKHREKYLPFTLIAKVAEPKSTELAPVEQTGQPEQSEEQAEQAEKEPEHTEEEPKQAEKQTRVRQGPLLPDTVIGKSLA